jgi:glycosyltransferase involved in cell wall biosynthesis
MYVSYDKNNVITAVSGFPFSANGQNIKKLNLSKDTDINKLVGKEIYNKAKKAVKGLRVAAICNWGDACGIATYSKFLLDEIKKKVADLHIFSEIVPQEMSPEANVTRCWKRGHSPVELLAKLKAYDPDFVIIQHEFGIFPKAGHFLQLLQGLDQYPYVLTLHSVYEHLDKSVCTSAVKNIVVHTNEGMEVLRKTGNNNNIFVVPHGCVKIEAEDRTELWNIFQTPFAIIQFGFGFYYKGVDTALEAVSILKKKNPEKYKEIFYCYLCSENPHANAIHTNYYNFLMDKTRELDIVDNVAIIRKFQTEQTLNHYLRTAKLALFPYRSDPNNVVYGASGATRIAMANGCPIIGGKNHQFDDLEGVIPRAGTAEELAFEIDKVFSDEKHRNSIIGRCQKYISDNTWDKCADKYLALYEQVLPSGIFAETMQ